MKSRQDWRIQTFASAKVQQKNDMCKRKVIFAGKSGISGPLRYSGKGSFRYTICRDIDISRGRRHYSTAHGTKMPASDAGESKKEKRH